jgi:cystathionine beta-lyase/cystathionine gamma-synthase
LVMPYNLQSMRRPPIAASAMLVRFSIGLENVADLQADFESALTHI